MHIFYLDFTLQIHSFFFFLIKKSIMFCTCLSFFGTEIRHQPPARSSLGFLFWPQMFGSSTKTSTTVWSCISPNLLDGTKQPSWLVSLQKTFTECLIHDVFSVFDSPSSLVFCGAATLASSSAYYLQRKERRRSDFPSDFRSLRLVGAGWGWKDGRGEGRQGQGEGGMQSWSWDGGWDQRNPDASEDKRKTRPRKGLLWDVWEKKSLLDQLRWKLNFYFF